MRIILKSGIFGAGQAALAAICDFQSLSKPTAFTAPHQALQYLYTPILLAAF